MNPMRVAAAADVIRAAMDEGRVTAAAFAIALDKAQLLQSPEMRAEIQILRGEREALAEDLREATADLAEAQAQIAEMEERRARQHSELTALRTDALNIRGALAPADGRRRVPFELGEALLPAVEWLLARVAELEARLAEFERPADEDPIAYALTEQAEAAVPVGPAEGDRYVKREAPDAGRVVTVTRVWTAEDGHTAVAYRWRDDRPGECSSACNLEVFLRTYAAEAGDR